MIVLMLKVNLDREIFVKIGLNLDGEVCYSLRRLFSTILDFGRIDLIE